MVLVALDQFRNSRNLLVEGVRRDEAKHPRYPQRIISPVCGLVGQPKNREGGRRRLGLHIASTEAIFILWFSVAVYPLASPSTTTESAEARPKLSATVIERRAISICLPRSR